MNTESDLAFDSTLSLEQEAIIKKLSPDDIQRIDNTLFSNTNLRWQKVAMVVASTMLIDLKNEYQDIPDIYFSQRIAYLVEVGKLKSQGDLRRMRYSEVRKTK